MICFRRTEELVSEKSCNSNCQNQSTKSEPSQSLPFDNLIQSCPTSCEACHKNSFNGHCATAFIFCSSTLNIGKKCCNLIIVRHGSTIQFWFCIKSMKASRAFVAFCLSVFGIRRFCCLANFACTVEHMGCLRCGIFQNVFTKMPKPICCGQT